MKEKGENKIALFFPSDRLSGAEKRFINMAYMFNKTEICSVFLIISDRAFLEGKKDSVLRSRLIFLDEAGVLLKIKGFNTRIKILNLSWIYIQLLVKILKYKIKTIHTGSGLIFLAPFLKVAKISVIYEVTSPDNVDLLIKTSSFFTSAIHKYNCVSESVFNRLVTSNSIFFSSNKQILRYNSLPFFIPIEISSEIKKEKLILFCSRFISRKNPILFLKAGIEVLRQNPEYRLVMLGNGPLKDSLLSHAADSRLGDRISIYRTPDPIDIFMKAEIFVGLIQPDNVPSQSALEALNCGNIIVVSDTGKSQSFIENDNGVLTDLTEADVINAINQIIGLTDNEKIRMSRNSIELIGQKFPYRTFLEELSFVYT